MENRDRDNSNNDPSKDDNHDTKLPGNEKSQPIEPTADKNSKPPADPTILAWARKFLPDYFTDQPADFHRELMSDLENPQLRQLARVAPRGHAKSTCISLAYPLWAICQQKRRNIVIVSNESTLAKQFVRDIRAELETNPQIRETYGDLFAPSESEPQAPARGAAPSEPAAPARKIRTHHASGGPFSEPQAPARGATFSEPQAPARGAAFSEPQAPARGATFSEPQAPARGARAAIHNTEKALKTPRKKESTSLTPRKTGKKKTVTAKKAARKIPPASRRRPIQSADASVAKKAAPTNAPTRAQSATTPKKRRPKNSESYFTTTTGVTVQAKGAGAAFRGLRVGPNRPDLILCDDIEKDAQVCTAEGRQKLEHWLRRVVLPALAPEGRIVVIGSILHSESLLATLADAKRWPRWDYHVYRALEAVPAPQSAESEPTTPVVGLLPSEPTTPVVGLLPSEPTTPVLGLLPSEPTTPVVGLFSPSAAAERRPTTRVVGSAIPPGAEPPPPAPLQFKIQNPKSKIASNGHHAPLSPTPPSLRRSVASSLPQPVASSLPTFHLRALWPARWPVARLLEERERIGTLAFEQEYQANPIDDALRVFRPDRLHRTSTEEIEQLDRENRLTNLLAIDPATGTTGGDYFALWAGGVDNQTGVIHTRELTLERIGIVEQVQRILAACQRYRPVRVGIETVAYQAALHQVLEDLSRTRNLYIPLVPIKTVANKRARIEGSACFYESGAFRLPAILPAEVELQFLQFPKARHDDAPDVCAMAIELARTLRTLTGSLVQFRRLNNPFNRPGGL